MVWPSADDRCFVKELNALSSKHSSAGFGDPGMLSRVKAQRQLAFAKAANLRWPELGKLKTVQEKGRDERVDVNCGFWKAGQKKYMEALGRYFHSLSCCKDAKERKDLLLDLGVLMIENFISEEEELDLLNYWDKDGPIFPLGTEEKRSRRRFFHYGPILSKETQGTSKSTLSVIPSQMGTMPPVVEHMKLQPRLRKAAKELATPENSLTFDQMYVNYYDTSIDSYIDFHHDHQSCMMGTIAGVSLRSSCQLQLKPLRQKDALHIELPNRSLFFMSGLSRWHLQHAIPQLQTDRLSLTFRTVDRSCSRAHQWARSWKELTVAEEANAHWPLVDPEGIEYAEKSEKSENSEMTVQVSGYSYYSQGRQTNRRNSKATQGGQEWKSERSGYWNLQAWESQRWPRQQWKPCERRRML